MDVILGIIIFITGYIVSPNVGNGVYKAESQHSCRRGDYMMLRGSFEGPQEKSP